MTRESVRETPVAAGSRPLPATHWKQLHRMRSPLQPDTTLEHVLVGPSGAFVISYQDAGGDLGRTRMIDVAVVQDSAAVVGALLPSRYQQRVRPVLCLRGGQELAEEVTGVMVTSPFTLEHILRSSPVVLSTSEVAEVSSLLQTRLEQLPPADARSARRWDASRLAAVAASVAAAAAGVMGVVALRADLLPPIHLW